MPVRYPGVLKKFPGFFQARSSAPARPPSYSCGGKTGKIPSLFPQEIMLFSASAKRGVGQGINVIWVGGGGSCDLWKGKACVVTVVVSTRFADALGSLQACPRHFGITRCKVDVWPAQPYGKFRNGVCLSAAGGAPRGAAGASQFNFNKIVF